jgi:hypothetical protein
MSTRDFAMVAKMYFMNTSCLAQRINVLKDPLVKIVASAAVDTSSSRDKWTNASRNPAAEVEIVFK